jgi:hypothetical protein
MSEFLIVGTVIVLFGSLAGFGFEKEWGIYISGLGALIALPSLFRKEKRL